MPNSKLIGVALGFALTLAAFFYARHIGYQACEVKQQAKEAKQAEVVSNVKEKDRKTKERVELETNSMADSAIDADLRRLGIMRPDTHN